MSNSINENPAPLLCPFLMRVRVNPFQKTGYGAMEAASDVDREFKRRRVKGENN
jgi:hypothetical protein